MTMTYVWRVETQQENMECALTVTLEVANRIEDFKPINNRMAHMTFNFGREKAIFMILYAPQQGRTEEEK